MMKSRIFILGLGNYTEENELAGTYHNIGFDIVRDFIAKNYFSNVTRFKHSYAYERENIVLLNSKTFMNNSGDILNEIICNGFFDPKNDIFCVAYDEFDLRLGSVVLKISELNSTHNGIRSIKSVLIKNKIPTCLTLKLGIHTDADISICDYVLKKFTSFENTHFVTAYHAFFERVLMKRFKEYFINALNATVTLDDEGNENFLQSTLESNTERFYNAIKNGITSFTNHKKVFLYHSCKSFTTKILNLGEIKSKKIDKYKFCCGEIKVN